MTPLAALASGIWQSDTVSVLGVASLRSLPLPLGASCQVRGVTVLRLPGDVPPGEKERPRAEGYTSHPVKKPAWRWIFPDQSPEFPTQFLNFQSTEL